MSLFLLLMHIWKRSFGHPVSKVFAYPYGSHSDASVSTLESLGFVQNLLNDTYNTSDNLDLSRLNRICAQQHYGIGTILKFIL